MPTAFPPAARLHRPSEYAAALKGRRIARGALFVVSGPREPAEGPARLGLVVPKRHAPLAVTRNAIKRVLREAFRLRRDALPDGDLVFRLVNRPPAASLTALKRQVRAEADILLARIAS
ncbi:ribonuclease P protein component [Castellaniella daejeonensis]|jgi:ribonuclease P protein component|uniref:Ribonuclease P protein component n=1 Tax=Castellaniella daejeonensis TaxID=659013 RepID=A0ABN0TUA4_9BURK|nr:ribonuclease P protein component [Castellaniella sp.]HET8703853.1 ribonuclease P protein component [Castellaniella sp.]